MKSDSVEVIYIGVDVSKAKLDIYVPATKEGACPRTMEVDNNSDGFKKLRSIAKKMQAVICVEPTGGYELELIAFMQQHKVSVAYADALRVRRFALAEGNLSKNDMFDAALISRFAYKIGVHILGKKDADLVELKCKTKFRQNLIGMRKNMESRLETEVDHEIRSMLEKEVTRFDKLIAKIECSCKEIVNRNEETKTLVKRFTEVGGVGDVTAIAILAGLPEIGKLPDAKLNRLVGIAPEEKQSGTKEWHRRIWGGRKDVRNALYMSTVSSLVWNAKIHAYYERKIAEGHPRKWAIIPAMRKMLSLLNRIARDPNFKPAPEPESTKANAPVGRKRTSIKC